MVHERLWSYLQNMITRMFWGQEQFGGGFCCAGTKELPPRSVIKGGLRTMGTIESLLLLNEFHPRSMHFPPGDDGDDILTSVDEHHVPLRREETAREGAVLDETTLAGWSEPAFRSDRMCWSLIGMSYTLAYELVRKFSHLSTQIRPRFIVVRHTWRSDWRFSKFLMLRQRP